MIQTETNSGTRFSVDHCGHCGGTWFDPYELESIPFHEVVRLAKLTVHPSVYPVQTEVHCPICRRVLKFSGTDVTPRNLRLLTCPKCHGVWASHDAMENLEVVMKDTEVESEKLTKEHIFPSLRVLFFPIASTTLLLLFTFITLNYLELGKENRTIASEMVTSSQVLPVTPDSVTINFATTTPITSFVTYGTSDLEMKTIPISLEPSSTHAVILTDLKPDTVYQYRFIFSDSEKHLFETPTATFHTLK